MSGRVRHGWVNRTYYVSSEKEEMQFSTGTLMADKHQTQEQIERWLLRKIEKTEGPGVQVSIVKSYLSALGPVPVPE